MAAVLPVSVEVKGHIFFAKERKRGELQQPAVCGHDEFLKRVTDAASESGRVWFLLQGRPVSERRSQVDLGLFISELHHLQQGAACRCGGVFQSAGLQGNSTLNASNGDLRGFHHMTSETINALAARSAF